MKIAQVDVLRSPEPIPLSHPYRAAWTEPRGALARTIEFAFYRLTTDDGLVGYGPYSGHRNPQSVVGRDPTEVGAFWEAEMGGRRAGNAGHGAAGLEIAMWDLVGKAAGLPVYRLLGATADRVQVYAATNRLLSAEETVEQVQGIVAEGFAAVKL
ncbi:MAG: hypothetical protein GX649_19935, partial [Chloroflexi bacterium]|nr:hypothetical protein [Chloroflexota bacterium]